MLKVHDYKVSVFSVSFIYSVIIHEESRSIRHDHVTGCVLFAAKGDLIVILVFSIGY